MSAYDDMMAAHANVVRVTSYTQADCRHLAVQVARLFRVPLQLIMPTETQRLLGQRPRVQWRTRPPRSLIRHPRNLRTRTIP